MSPAAANFISGLATRSRLYLSFSDGAEGRVRAEGLLEVEHDERADAHHRHDLKRLLHLLITRATSACDPGYFTSVHIISANTLGANLLSDCLHADLVDADEDV